MLPIPEKPSNFKCIHYFTNAGTEVVYYTSSKTGSLLGKRIIPCRKPVRSVAETPPTSPLSTTTTTPKPHQPGWKATTYSLLDALNQTTSALTILEVAALFKVSDKTIRRMVTRREIPSILVGGQRRFDPRTLHWWLVKRSPEMGKASGF